MYRRLACGLAVIVATGLVQLGRVWPAAADRSHVALVIGNAAYRNGPLATALNDAGLVAEALNSAGFEVVAGADLSQAEMRAAFRNFLTMVAMAGPDVDALVYFAGYGVELDGENYLLPIDVRLEQSDDVPIESVRLADLVRPLTGTSAASKIVILDAARALPFAPKGGHVMPGFAALDASPGLIFAMSCAPGLTVQYDSGPYGPYSMAIAEMIREGAPEFDDVFTDVRRRTYWATQGRQIPWYVSALPPRSKMGLVAGRQLSEFPQAIDASRDSRCRRGVCAGDRGGFIVEVSVVCARLPDRPAHRASVGYHSNTPRSFDLAKSCRTRHG